MARERIPPQLTIIVVKKRHVVSTMYCERYIQRSTFSMRLVVIDFPRYFVHHSVTLDRWVTWPANVSICTELSVSPLVFALVQLFCPTMYTLT